MKIGLSELNFRVWLASNQRDHRPMLNHILTGLNKKKSSNEEKRNVLINTKSGKRFRYVYWLIDGLEQLLAFVRLTSQSCVNQWWMIIAGPATTCRRHIFRPWWRHNGLPCTSYYQSRAKSICQTFMIY